MRDQDKLVGFINMQPVKHETIMKFMKGEIKGWEIAAEDVLPFAYELDVMNSDARLASQYREIVKRKQTRIK